MPAYRPSIFFGLVPCGCRFLLKTLGLEFMIIHFWLKSAAFATHEANILSAGGGHASPFATELTDYRARARRFYKSRPLRCSIEARDKIPPRRLIPTTTRFPRYFIFSRAMRELLAVFCDDFLIPPRGGIFQNEFQLGILVGEIDARLISLMLGLRASFWVKGARLKPFIITPMPCRLILPLLFPV